MKLKPSRRVDHLTRFWLQVKKTIGGCWLWTGSPGTGKSVHQRFGVNKIRTFVHRYSYEIHIGPIPDGMCVLHKCDVPRCVNPSHLFLGTHKDNMQDMEKKGRSRHPFGEKAGQAKLTENQIKEIRYRRSLGERPVDLAKVFGVSDSHISNICREKSIAWKHLK